MWDVATGAIVAHHPFPYGNSMPTALEFLDDNRIFVGFRNGSVVLYDVRDPGYAFELASSHGPERYNMQPRVLSIR